MITFIIGLLILAFGYIFYSRYTEKQFGLDENKTPAHPTIVYVEGADRNARVEVEVAAQYNDGYVSNIYSFCNNIKFL